VENEKRKNGKTADMHATAVEKTIDKSKIEDQIIWEPEKKTRI
jgi:hypothetical protein